MKKATLFVAAIALSVSAVFSQQSDSIVNVNDRLKLVVDSIGRIITEERWGTDTSYYVYYKVLNVSEDTVLFVTNSCPSYNQHHLRTADTSYHVNQGISCGFNDRRIQKIFPGASASFSDDMHNSFAGLRYGVQYVTFTIPVVVDARSGIRIDGRDFIEKTSALVFEGEIPIVSNTAHQKNKRLKKKRKSTETATSIK